MKSSQIKKYFSSSQDDEGERDVTTYTVLILEKSSVQINDLTPDTTYMFRVQALSPEGSPGSYSVEHEFHTSPLGTSSLEVYGRSNSFCPLVRTLMSHARVDKCFSLSDLRS